MKPLRKPKKDASQKLLEAIKASFPGSEGQIQEAIDREVGTFMLIVRCSLRAPWRFRSFSALPLGDFGRKGSDDSLRFVPGAFQTAWGYKAG